MLRRNVLHTDKPFTFEAGGVLESMDIVYHTSPRDYSEGEKVLWICHALTGNSDPEDWWPQIVGPGKLFDPEKFYVVCVSMIASPYGLCGPAEVNPDTGKPYLMDFPRTTVRDMVNAGILVRRHLGIGSIDLMLGPSIGGFQTVEWTVMEPEVVKKAAFIATDVRVSPFVTAFNESQRMAIKADASFLQAADVHGGQEGLRCARSIALISYRTFEGYNLTQQENGPDTLFADRASSYQRHQGDKLVARDFDAYSYWYLTYALDSHNIGRGRGGVEAALASIRARVLVISITSDVLFPASHGKSFSAMIPGAVYRGIDSIFGHDGFLIENDQLVSILRETGFC